MADDIKTVEVPDVTDQPKPVTLSDLAESGLSSQEIEMAKKNGMAAEEKTDGGNEDSESGKDPDEPGGDIPAAAGTKPDEGGIKNGKKEESKTSQKTVDERFRILGEGKSPEAIIAEIAEQGDLSPLQEKALLASLTQNGKTLYWSQKKYRKRAQDVEAKAKEQEEALAKANAEIEELRKNNARNKNTEDPLDIDGENGEGPENADPKDKPITQADLDRIEKEKNTRAAQEAKAREDRVRIMTEALDDQQAEAKERYEDFDAALGHTKELISAANAGRLSEFFSDPREQSRIEREIFNLLGAYANADRFEPGQFNAADMTYELGKKHPQFGKTKKAPPKNADKNGETDADGNPENTRRAITNANRRGSSAALNGGGSRSVVNLEELTPEQASRLSDKQYRELPQSVRERLLGKS